MRKKRLALVSLVVGCALVLETGCQEQTKVEIEPSTVQIMANELKVEVVAAAESSPRITFESTVLDFGDVGPNTENVGQYEFKNTGKTALKITEVKRCCGVVTEWDKNKEYAPGESGIITVKWRSGTQPSLFVRRPVVYSNDTANPAMELTLRAKTVQRISCNPEGLMLFLDEENAGCPKITLNSTDGRPFSITGFASTADVMTADFDPSVEATTFVLKPEVNMEKLCENLRGRINIGTTHPEGNLITVFFKVLPKYTCMPSSLMIFSAEPGKPIVKRISVLDNHGGDFEIDSVSSKGNTVAIEVMNQRRIPNGYQLDIAITPPDGDGIVRFTDEFSINIKGSEKLVIKCNGGFFSKKSGPKTY